MSLLFSIIITLLSIILIVLHILSLKYQKSLQLSANVFKNMDEAILITDENQTIIDINDAVTKMFGYTKEECIGETPRMLKSGQYSENFYHQMWEEISQTGFWQGKINDLAKDGSIVESWLSINVVKNSYGKTVNYIAIHRDISEILQSQKHVDFLAYHDSLTELPNRVSFEENLITSINYAQKNKKRVIILFIDLDRFKIVNDSLGHDIGDKLLVEVAKRLQNSIRAVDHLSRIGGDEFVITLSNVNQSFDASIIAKKILAKLDEPFELEGNLLNTSASIGIAQYPIDALDAVSLVKYADSAMYDAKESGKNCFRFFTEKMSDNINKKLKIEQELRKALKKNELYLNFQPQYILKTKKVMAVESLLRWKSETLGVIGPDVFIPVAEDSGLIQEIGYFVFRESCAFIKELRDKDIFLEHIAINVSSQQFQQQDMVEVFLKIIAEYELTPNLIEIEITERYIMESTEENINILDTLKNKGFKISIDDFGTGYSSMSYLKNYH
ncbi:MAG: diguanylate cyclase [Sulfurimonas sp.]|nr:diguanylate cyclase [Sulfurimonas sp.]